jgi:hypothetical protein
MLKTMDRNNNLGKAPEGKNLPRGNAKVSALRHYAPLHSCLPSSPFLMAS